MLNIFHIKSQYHFSPLPHISPLNHIPLEGSQLSQADKPKKKIVE